MSCREILIIGKNIRRLRKSMGLSQLELADAAGTRATTVSLIETGTNSNPSWKILVSIARVLHCSIHELTKPGLSSKKRTSAMPKNLKKLVHNQNRYLALSESRISIGELEWLVRTPNPENREMLPEDYLLILRFFRLSIGSRN